MQQLGGRSDRIARQEQRKLAADAGCDQPQRERRRPVDIAIRARLGVGGWGHPVLHVEQLGRLSERPAGTERGQVRFGHRGIAGELLLDPALGYLGGPSVQP